MPGAPSSFLLLVAMPGAPSSFLLLVARGVAQWGRGEGCGGNR